MGAIDIAVDRALDRRIALKTLHPHLRPSEGAVRMFLREARLTGLLDHPHIVPVYDIGERDSEHLYFAMKLVEGRTLGDIIRALPRGPLDTATLYALLDVVTKVCDALAFAHSRGVIHCDIKPANVMVGEFGQVYLMDWGIARLVAAEGSPSSAPGPYRTTRSPRSTTDNSVIGTPCYMSPEQARGDRMKLDARSDVFLLGSLLYELITRRPPYASADRAETLSLAVAGSFPPPRKVAEDGSVPVELERIDPARDGEVPRRSLPDRRGAPRGSRALHARRRRLPAQDVRRGRDDHPRGRAGRRRVHHRRGPAATSRRSCPAGTETLMSIGPGAVFGEMAIMTEGPRTATVVATEPTTVLVVTPAILEQEMEALEAVDRDAPQVAGRALPRHRHEAPRDVLGGPEPRPPRQPGADDRDHVGRRRRPAAAAR